MAKNKKKKKNTNTPPETLIFVNGLISVECERCAGDGCEMCNKKGFVWGKYVPPKTNKTEQHATHAVYKLHKIKQK